MKEVLTRGLPELGLDPSLADRLCQFADLLLAKNQVMNLTAITEPTEVATLHFLDSLAITQYAHLHGKSLVDVGTGAGFPGLPLKLAIPDLRVTLLDSLGKRITFLQECCDLLRLEQIECIHARAEDLAMERRETYDFAVSRAVAALPVLCELCLPLVKPGGCFLAMKSVDTEAEISEAKRAIHLLGGKISSVEDYTIPQSEIRHRLVIVEKLSASPSQYPRPFAKIKKSPL